MTEVGGTLRAARHEKNLSLSEVARCTRIKETYLEALEEGDYNLLPGPAYVTGFLRNYARFLGLHPDEVVEEFHAYRPPPQPDVKAATRVLASGHERHNRKRLFWVLSAFALMLGAGYAIRQYNDIYAHPYSAPLITPANLGVAAPPKSHARTHAASSISVSLRATAPVWVRVTADNRRVFQGILRPAMLQKHWSATNAIYVLTYDGTHIKARYDGHPLGKLASGPGLILDAATPTGWQKISS